jgi:tetratricopeptide (TPR) repeat protein
MKTMNTPRVGLIYDHKRVEAIGHFCLRAMLELATVDHLHPADLGDLVPNSCDVYFYVDDGWNYAWRRDLRPCAYWAIETPLNFARCLRRAEDADWVFAAQRCGAESLKNAGVADVEWLPLACDPLIHRPHAVAKSWDICFVGRLIGTERQALVKLLKENFTATYVGRAYSEEASRIYSGSRTVFNRSVDGDLNLRVFEALACGSLLTTDTLEKNGLDELFRDGTHLVTYTNGEELLDKVRYYLAHDDLRERIARSGRQEALSRHTFVHRMRRVLDVIQQQPRAQHSMSGALSAGHGTCSMPAAAANVAVGESASESRVLPSVSAVPSEKPCLSLCMIVRNSERTLRECLASIRPWVDEMVIVDTGSVDATRAIAGEFGARLHHFTWCDDFSAARNESLRHAKGRWMFWMDADDTISAENGRGLRDLAINTSDEDLWAYVMQVHCPGGKQDGPDGVTVVDHVKVLRNRPEIRFDGRIHEQVLSSIRRGSGRVAWTNLFVVHSGSDLSAEGHASKIERDLRILLLELQERPEHPFTLFNLGMTFSEMRAFDLAARFLRRSLAAADPQESHVRKAYALLVHCCAQNGQLESAWDALNEGLRQYPSDIELRFREGLLHQLTGDSAEAERAYWRVLTTNEGRHFASVDRGIVGYKARQNLAQIYKDRGEFAKAELQWRQITREYPRYGSAWEGLMEALVCQGRLPEANLLTIRLSEDPQTRFTGYLLHGKLAQTIGDAPKARRVWEEAARACKDDLEPLRCLCQLVFNTGTAEESKDLLESLVERDPADAAARHNLGMAYLRLKRPREAAAAFRASLRLRPHAAMTVLNLGIALDHLDQRSEARAAWQKVVRQDPQSPAAHEARVRLAEEHKFNAPAA